MLVMQILRHAQNCTIVVILMQAVSLFYNKSLVYARYVDFVACTKLHHSCDIVASCIVILQ